MRFWEYILHKDLADEDVQLSFDVWDMCAPAVAAALAEAAGGRKCSFFR